MPFVQRVTQLVLATSATPQTVSITNAPAAGNRLILTCKFSNSRTVTGVTDTKGNTWSADMVGTLGTARCSVFSTPQDGGTLTTSDTLSVTLSAAGQGIAIIDEYSGVMGGTSGYLDGTPSDTGGSGTSPATAPSITTTGAGSLIYTAVTVAGSTLTISTVPTGFTDRGIVNSTGSGSADSADQVADAGTYSANWVWSGTSAFDVVILGYLAAGTVAAASPLERPTYLPLMAPQGGI